MPVPATPDDSALFAVLDIESTGFSPMVDDRIVELAILRIASDGSIVDEYDTLVNPLRDVGPTHVHGLTADDVASAPTFHEILGDVLQRLRNVIVVCHNAQFDLDFLGAALASEGVFLPAVPSICTLKLSYRLSPGLESYKLESCCVGAGVAEATFHSALEDARATSRLLLAYVHTAGERGLSVQDLIQGGRLSFPATWPDVSLTRRVSHRPERAFGRLDPPFVAGLVAKLAPAGLTESTAPYVDLLDRVLEDRRVTLDESTTLEATATKWGLTREQVAGVHLNYVEALVRAALADRVITSTERRDLLDVARLLGVGPATVDGLIVKATPAT